MDQSPSIESQSQSPSMTIVTAQMASVSMFTTDYRKQAFASTNHSSWPTPPTELDHDFPHDSCEEMDKTPITLPPLQDPAGIQSPPASPGQWSNKLPPLQTTADSPSTQGQLPPISTELRHPLFPSPHLSPEERVDQVSVTSQSEDLGIYKIFPQFKGADREYFRKYRDARYAELAKIPGWRPINKTHSPVQASVQAPEILPSRRLPASPRQKPVEALRPSVATNRVTKPAQRPKVAKINTSSPVSRPTKTPTKTREGKSSSVDPEARKRAAPTKKIEHENLVDCAPPVSTLDNMATKLHVVWRGSPNDLSNDPDNKNLHPQEVEIAESLKLSASQYITNKKRIFDARFRSIKDRKNFTKTAAQQACSIDVNKTSQLYEAFERVGWFDESYFKKWLE